MFTDRTVVSRVLCLLSLATLASCFGKPIKIKAGDAAVAGRQSDGSGAGGEAGPGDGPGPVADSKIATDGSSSNGEAGGNSVGGRDGSASGGGGATDGGTDGSAGGASTSDGSANGGSSAGGNSGGGNGGTGGGIAGSGGAGPDAAPDVQPDVPAVDAPGTCSADRDCPSQAPLCLGNRCAKCAGDSDCAGRAGPACAASGLCVACTANKHCTGAAATCDTATNQCVGCVNRSDCASTCQTCTSGVCTAVKGKDDPGFCDGTCDSVGACKKKQGQICAKTVDCAGGIPCADGYCCDTPCTEQCKACNISGSTGTCTRLSSGMPTSGRTPCAGSDTCGGSCNTSSDSCVYPPASQKCGAPATCSIDLATVNASACNGTGSCLAANLPCGTGYCDSTTVSCKPKNNSGNCSDPVQCSSGNCTGGVCCPANQTGCNGICVDLKTNSSYCGSCTKSCSGLSCCNGACVDTNTSLSNCGQCGSTCNGNCSGGSCCRGASLSCGSTANCGVWDFEGDSTQGWRIDSPSGTNAATNIAASSTRHSEGQYSLAVTISNGVGPAYVVVPLCPNGSATNVTGYHISASIFLDGPAWSFPPTQDYSGFFTVASDNAWLSESAPFSQSSNGPLRAGVWVPFDGTFGTAPTLTSLSLGFMLADAPATWFGTMYIDDVVLTTF